MDDAGWPLPAADFGHVLFVLLDVLTVLDQRLRKPLLQRLHPASVDASDAGVCTQ